MINKTLAVKEPLAPQILMAARVPIEDALWYSRLTPAGKVKALSMEARGKAILEKVRKYLKVATTQHSTPVPA